VPFEEKEINEECALAAVSNIQLIYSILVGMADFWDKQVQKSNRLERNYYEADFVKNADKNEIWSQAQERSLYKIDVNPYRIEGLSAPEGIILTEYAPLLFRNIRHDFTTEATLQNSFTPSHNPEGIFNFKTGGGKSPSFFFFTDDGKFMIKTLKKSEKDILL
jgi:hypothetical protein